jgi:hypothetical protein
MANNKTPGSLENPVKFEFNTKDNINRVDNGIFTLSFEIPVAAIIPNPAGIAPGIEGPVTLRTATT